MTSSGPVAGVPPLGSATLEGATVHPTLVSPDPTKVHCGVVRADGTLVASTIDDRRHGTHTFIPPDPSLYGTVEDDPGEVVYAGAYHPAYGHFMLECLQRLWWAAERPDLPIVWVGYLDGPVPTLTHWQRDMLELVGVRNEVRVITRPTRFARVHVPDAGYKYGDWSHPDHIRFLAAHDGPPQEAGAKVWLSRASESGVGLVNREIVERRLRRRGWTIATMERMTLRDQLDTLARAEVVAGEEGSTFHTLLLLRDVSTKKFHVFRRHGPEHISFATIGEARAVDQTFHSCSDDAVISATGRAVVRLAPNASQYLSHLGLHVPRVDPVPPDWTPGHTVRRINRLAQALGAATFLQVGWRHRYAFTEIAVETRDVVDEQFRFDVRSYRGSGAAFWEVTLDRFLTWFAAGRTYDLVLLDDLEDWRTALDRLRRVFDAASHDRTVVVVDNTAPTSADGGDVFKAVLAVHDLHPELSYRTITTRGVAQTVVWRQARTVEPRFAGEDAVAALTHADLDTHRDLLAPVGEAQAVADVAAWLGTRAPQG
ncbi:glycosyltransferase 61 family protein [Nocardioides sp. 1609]|uniref:glycosyltransferase family 61 protein n=1 Tax=Nocardioides sp. 1609 TaxID=2508327 RepID=UPI00106F3C2E|nr:glycosyltransferase 61 family protein [Nocardioides sp. 1609]